MNLQVPPVEQEPDIQFGELAVKKGYLTFQRLRGLLVDLAAERARGMRVSLGDLLVRRGIVTPPQIRDLLGEQGKAIFFCEACVLRYNILGHDPTKSYFCKQCAGPLTITRRDDPSEYDWTSGDSSTRLPVITEAEILTLQNRAFGEIAVAKKYITADELDLALAMSQKANQPIGSYCVSKGLLHPGQVEEILGEQNKTVLLCRSCGAVYTVRNYDPQKTYPCRKCKCALETAVLESRLDGCEDYPEP